MTDSGAGPFLAANRRANGDEWSERSLLQRLRSRIPPGPGVLIGLGDDAAAVRTTSLTLVTTDCLVEGIHFRRDWSPPRLLGRKALSVNLSDIAAMAGIPRYATVSLCLPRKPDTAFLDQLYDGLLERAREAGVQLVGGNLAATDGPLVVDVTLLGESERPLRRSGAQAGDRIVVTGTLGAAAAALAFLERGARLGPDGRLPEAAGQPDSALSDLTRCLRAQLDPEPPVGFGKGLAALPTVHAAIDVSDGLSGDLLSLCRESGVAASIEASAVPVDQSAARLEPEGGPSAFALALHGGEDYQLLLAVAPEGLADLREVARAESVRLTVLGEFRSSAPALFLREGGGERPLRPRSHDHFAARRREGGDDAAPEA